MHTDLPVPRSPNTSKPPIAGSTAFKSKPIFISSCPTILVNGNSKVSSRAAIRVGVLPVAALVSPIPLNRVLAKDARPVRGPVMPRVDDNIVGTP
eukprot:1382869-Amorphochlora_amoeboformis.AAC.1